MALDIREGDYLIVGAKSYPIRSCATWAWYNYRSMARLLRVTASTKRSNRTTGLAVNLTNVKCTPLDPVDPELKMRLDLKTPGELLQTFADGTDVFYRLILEDLKV